MRHAKLKNIPQTNFLLFEVCCIGPLLKSDIIYFRYKIAVFWSMGKLVLAIGTMINDQLFTGLIVLKDLIDLDFVLGPIISIQ